MYPIRSLLYLMVAVALCSVSVTSSNALTLTPEQMQKIQQLSPAEREALAKQAGVSPSPNPAKSVNSPRVIKLRTVGTGPLEREASAVGADSGQQAAEVSQSSAVDVPVEKVAGSAGADKLEIRRAFSDFVSESKPLIVNAENLKQFGYDLFAGSPTTFAPATDVPVPAEYVLGPGDELEVQLFGAKNDQFTLVVDREGVVAFPEIGPVVLAGMSFSGAKALLAQQIGEKMIGVTASISMGKLRSIRIFALGEVAKPGSYVVSGLATLSHALLVSGGVKKIGSLRNIQLKRGGKVVGSIDLYDFLLRGDTGGDMRLLPGDVVFVPPIGITVGIAGEVARPAIYEVGRRTDVGDMVKLAGGYLPKAYRAKALLERINRSGEKEVLNFPLKGRGLKTRIRNGDVIKVFSILEFERNPVLLIGNVKRPGKYAWKKGMHLSQLLPNQDVLLPETFMDYGLIEREAEGNREPEVIRFRLSDLFVSGKQHVDVSLKPRDKVYVFHRSHFRQAPQATIAGSVKSPGSYELKKNMQILDLILAAGGTTKDTSFADAELYRTDPVTKKVSISHFSVSDVMEGSSLANLFIQDLDKVIIHSIWENQHRKVLHIQGEVNNPGEFEFGEGMKVSDLIFAAGGVTRNVLLENIQIYRTDEASKKISLITVDLPAVLQGDEKNNIALQDLDKVIIHSIWETVQRHKVYVHGAIKKPGAYDFASSGMRLSDLVFAAGGVTEQAFLQQTEITRYKIVNGEKRETTHFEVRLGDALNGVKEADVLLQPYDVLMVRTISNWRSLEQVELKGEFKFPGIYIIEDGETISQVIERAGGFTKDAFVSAAFFSRKSIREQQKKILKEYADRLEREVTQAQTAIQSVNNPKLLANKQKGLSAAQTVLEKYRKLKPEGRLLIDIDESGKLKDGATLKLADADTLYVPKRPDQVMVIGEVYNQSAMLYRKNMDRDDFIALAGGATSMADDDRIYIIRANGYVDSGSGWSKNTTMYPGDSIVVPQKLEAFNLLDSTLDWSKVLMQIGVFTASMVAVGIL